MGLQSGIADFSLLTHNSIILPWVKWLEVNHCIDGAHKLKLYIIAQLWEPYFPGNSAVKNPPANSEDVGSIPGWGRSLGEENGNPLQYSCQENPMDREAWWGHNRVRHD